MKISNKTLKYSNHLAIITENEQELKSFHVEFSRFVYQLVNNIVKSHIMLPTAMLHPPLKNYIAIITALLRCTMYMAIKCPDGLQMLREGFSVNL